jgi:hypothetical protein
MIIEKGDISNPSGNAIIYWRIRGNTALFNNAEIIASNFVISPLHFKNEILMVNFPPVIIESYEKLLEIAENNGIDLIKGEDIYIPDDMVDFSSFYKSQIEKYNGLIQEYLIAYREKNQGGVATLSLPQLLNQAGELMENVRALVKSKAKRGLIEKKIARLREIQKYLNREMRGFDLAGVIRILDKPDPAVDRLVDLYRQKWFAIFLENYEKAEELKREIVKLEESLRS